MRLLIPGVFLAVALALGHSQAPASAADQLDITTRVVYDIRPDTGSRHVSWQISILNNDPSTTSAGENGQVHFYEGFSIPVLAGAQNLSATSNGIPLNVPTSDVPDSPIMAADVEFDSPLFFGESYAIDLSYDIAETRREGLLVTSAYAFIPVVAVGDNATVAVNLPEGRPWSASIEPAECAGGGPSFECSGSDGIYVAALAELSRPDLTASSSAEVQLSEKMLNLRVSYFQGEDAFAKHVKELATVALPVMEELYGFSYPGPEDIHLEERGRVITLGYEGLASCDDTACEIAVSPVSSDHTILHEMAHLWSSLYENRWLSEGFAEFIAVETASRLPAGLLTGNLTISRNPESSFSLTIGVALMSVQD
jgi:hypothetical protein